MATHDKSMLTEVAEGVKARIEAIMDYYKENPPSPLLTEKVSKGEARERFLAMNPQQRQEMMSQVGLEGMMELFRKQKRGAP